MIARIRSSFAHLFMLIGDRHTNVNCVYEFTWTTQLLAKFFFLTIWPGVYLFPLIADTRSIFNYTFGNCNITH
jgi:hypothetical protein